MVEHMKNSVVTVYLFVTICTTTTIQAGHRHLKTKTPDKTWSLESITIVTGETFKSSDEEKAYYEDNYREHSPERKIATIDAVVLNGLDGRILGTPSAISLNTDTFIGIGFLIFLVGIHRKKAPLQTLTGPTGAE